jgi:riboflavin biosynthesis pyrimidine reductase
VRMIFPSPGGELDLPGLAAAYAYPRERWVRANMVESADGAVSVDGLSAGLSSAEGYRPALRRPSLAALRAGRPETATIAVVSRGLRLDLAAPLFTQAAPDARTIVITCAAADAGLRAATAAVADVIVAGDDSVDLPAALDALAGRGLGRVLCEGGPHLLGDLAAAGLLDELCLTLSPVLAGAGAGRILAGQPSPARRMTVGHVMAADDGFCFFRYLTGSGDPG